MEPNNPTETSNTVVHKEGSVGPVIGTIIILAVILLGGLYFWGNRNNSADLNSDSDIEAQVQDIETQGNSDDLNSIESDLNNTNYDVKTDLNAS
jgi:hypothetical protein